MYQNDYLFFPEAKTVDKLLSLFNIQSQETLQPDKMISILGLLNLLNIVSVANDGGSEADLSQLANNNSPATGGGNVNSQQINQLMNSLNNNQTNTGNSASNLGNALNNDSALQSVVNMLNNKGNNSQLDPTLLLKLMNLFNQMRSNSQSDEEEKGNEANEPVKSEPYDEEEE